VATVIGVVDGIDEEAADEDGKVDDDGGLSVESNICRLKTFEDDEQPFIFNPSFSAI
jgi:hypothetical protein